MELQRLRLRNFRNIVDETVELAPQINVFVGDNGQGKTNFLESIYVCSHGKSFRTSKFEHLLNNQSEQALIEAKFTNEGLESKIEIRFSIDQKTILLNEKKVFSSVLIQKFPTVLFSPESLQAIKEGPEGRRRLVDELIISVDPKNSKVISEFEKVLRTKNKILRDHSSGILSRTQAKDLLESLIPPYIERATELTTARLNALRNLSEGLKKIFRAIINGPNVDISVDYVISGDAAQTWSREKVHDAIAKRQQELLLRELESGMCLVGPHKHEIRFLYNGNDSRFFCSQGQQRAIILSFKISQVMEHNLVHGTSPVLLLDDVLSELDSERRDFLVRFLKDSDAQTIVTTTDLAFCNELRSEKLAEFNVKQGHVVRSN